MERIVFLCLVSTSLSAVPVQKFLFTPKWVPIGYKGRQIHGDLTAMDEIITANEVHATRFVDGTTSLREGDIAVTSGRRSKVCFARSCLWSKSVDGHVYIPYRVSSDYTETQVQLIKKAMENIEEDTCVRFVPRTHQQDFIDIQRKTGCWSYLGARGGRQTVSLQSPDCVQLGVISHEFMHALGFVHEQSRPDRDKYVTIMWPNIWRDRLRNFEKFRTYRMTTAPSCTLGCKYSYSMEGEPTIIPKNSKNTKLGQTSYLSNLDKLKINRLYKCGDADDYQQS